MDMLLADFTSVDGINVCGHLCWWDGSVSVCHSD